MAGAIGFPARFRTETTELARRTTKSPNAASGQNPAIRAATRERLLHCGACIEYGGQILVTDDLLSLFGAFTTRFVERYAERAGTVSAAAEQCARDVRARQFPGAEHHFGSWPG